ncbi:ABC transporter permease [Paenibacillus fonticola]|uniref:ABC transporter permease n=1 Tax=Paenibacillus fonticola TaxID=379896 RepID=UPI00037B4C4B|nr:ABC transporter permease [Paenibacillus fonticola]
MIKSVKDLAFRFFKTNRFLSLSSVISIAIAVCLTIVMTIYIFNANQSYRDEIKKLYGNMDIMAGFNPEQRLPIESDLLAQMSSIPGIAESSPVLLDHLYLNELHSSVYTIGAESDDLTKSKYHFTENISADEVIINAGLAEALHAEVGQAIMLEGIPFTVKEILPDLNNSSGSTNDLLIMPRNRLKEFIHVQTGIQNEASYVLIKNEPGVNSFEVAKWLKQADQNLRIDIVEEEEGIKSNLISLRIFIIVLSVLVLIVTALLITSNLQTYLYKYKEQFAIMRSIGARADDLFKIIFIQSLIINITGGILGYISAFLASKYSRVWFERLFAVSVEDLSFNFGLAFVVLIADIAVIQIFMLIPAYRASTILPLQVLQGNEKGDFSFTKARRKLGKFIMAAGIFLLIYGKILTASYDSDALLVLLGILLFIIGVFVLFPLYLSALLTGLLPVIQRLLGRVSFVAIKNVIPQVRKNTFVILSLSITMIIAVVGSTLMTTIKGNEANYIRGNYPTDILISSRAQDSALVDYAELRSALARIDGVEGASIVSSNVAGRMWYEETNAHINYVMADLQDMIDQQLIPGYDGSLREAVYITKPFADRYQISEGDALDLGLYSNSRQADIPVSRFNVARVVDKLPGVFGEHIFIDWSNTPYITDYIYVKKIFISSSEPSEQLVAQLEALKGQFPGLRIDTYEQTMQNSKQMFYQRWSLFIIVLIVMLAGVLIGVINSLLNNFHSKRKELAILRTLSVTRGGISRVVLTQAFAYTVTGLLLGAAIGILLSYALMLIDPVGMRINYQVMGVLTGAVTASVIAVLWPYSAYLGRRSLTRELTQDG